MSNLNWKIKKWQEEARVRELNKFKDNKCDICNNRGYIIDYRVIEGNEYQYSLHCKCPHGEKWKPLMYSYEKHYTESQLKQEEETCPF